MDRSRLHSAARIASPIGSTVTKSYLDNTNAAIQELRDSGKKGVHLIFGGKVFKTCDTFEEAQAFMRDAHLSFTIIDMTEELTDREGYVTEPFGPVRTDDTCICDFCQFYELNKDENEPIQPEDRLCLTDLESKREDPTLSQTVLDDLEELYAQRLQLLYTLRSIVMS